MIASAATPTSVAASIDPSLMPRLSDARTTESPPPPTRLNNPIQRATAGATHQASNKAPAALAASGSSASIAHSRSSWPELAPRERRNLVNYGHGPGPFKKIDNETSDNEEVAVSLLEEALAPYFRLPPSRMNQPDYNVANKRHLD